MSYWQAFLERLKGGKIEFESVKTVSRSEIMAFSSITTFSLTLLVPFTFASRAEMLPISEFTWFSKEDCWALSAYSSDWTLACLKEDCPMWSDVTDATRNSKISTGHDLPIQINSVIKIIGQEPTYLPSPLSE